MPQISTPKQSWWQDINTEQRKALIAATLGWILDSMDVLLYAIVLGHLIEYFDMSFALGGFLNSLTLMSSAIGGIAFGLIADRIGRVKAMMMSILVYSIFTAACGFSQTITQLAIFRIILGLGVGGEWSTGAALISETWPSQHKGKAFGIMQSGFAIGYALAALVAAIVMPIWGWRAVFFVGIIPALFTLWIRRNVKEPAEWLRTREKIALNKLSKPSVRQLFKPGVRRSVIVASMVSICAMFSSWGLFLWIPPLLSLSTEQGGAGLGNLEFSVFLLVMHSGSFAGYLTFGALADRFSRKKIYISYVMIAAVLIPFYSASRDPFTLLFIGPLIGFFGAGHFAGFGVITGELFPTHIRATAQGFSYNIGRGVSALAPYTIGTLVDLHGFTAAFQATAAMYVLTGLCLFLFPETGKTEGATAGQHHSFTSS